MTAEQALTFWGILSAILNLGLGWWAIKLNRDKTLMERPWLTPDPPRQGGKLFLTGPTADLWKIEKIEIKQPKRAEFFRDDPIKDDGGSIIQPRTTRAGTTLTGGDHYFGVSSPSWPVELRVKIALRTDPKRTSSLVVRMSA